MLLNHLSERVSVHDAQCSRSAHPSGPAARRATAAAPRRIPPGDRPAGLALRSAPDIVARKAGLLAAPAEHRRTSPTGSSPARARRGCSCGRPSISAGTTRPVDTPLPGAVRAHVASATHYELSPAGRCRPCDHAVGGATPAFTLESARASTSPLPRRGEPRIRLRGRALEPRASSARAPAGDRRRFVASTEPWETRRSRSRRRSCSKAERERRRRLLAAGRARRARAAWPPSWCWRPISSSSRRPAASRKRPGRDAAGDEARTVIAGYHWFTDWGRDTMISLEGLTLTTGRHVEAGYILRTFAHYVRDGLIPNLFPEGERQGLYHTADATLWFFHALDRYRRDVTGDRATLRAAVARAERHRRAPPARHALRHRRRSGATACCARARRAISSPGWTPRSATGW